MSAIATAATAIPAGTWAVDPVHSAVGFEVRHLGISTYRGHFPGASGRVEVDADGRIVALDGEVDLATVTTADATLAGHLRSPDFFDVEAHPVARFRATDVRRDGDAVAVEGVLELRGIENAVELRGTLEGVGVDPYGNDRLGLALRGTIDRTAWGITWNAPLANGALAVAEKVALVLHVEAVRSAS